MYSLNTHMHCLKAMKHKKLDMPHYTFTVTECDKSTELIQL